jgi:peptide/nickel transport system substrate-binding protein
MDRFRLGFTCTRLIVSILVLILILSCGTAAPPEDTGASSPAATISALEGTLTPAATEPSQPAGTAQPAVTATAVPAATPAPTPAVEAQPARDDVKIVLAAEPPGLDLFQTSGSEHSTIYRENMTDLISWVAKDTKELVPLSGFTGWEQVAPDRWRFHLREGVKFHNGEVFDAAAAVVSVNIQGDPDQATDSFADTGPITGEVVDPLTMEVVCAEVCPIFPRAAKALGFQAPKWYTENPEDVTSRNTMGLGPYRLRQWDPGIAIHLEAHPDYVPNPEVPETQAPVIQNVTYLFREETTVRAAMVNAGEADLANNIAIADEGNVPVFHRTASGLNPFLAIDTIWNPVLKNVKVRQALAQGFDCQEIVDTVLNGATTCRGNAGFPGINGITEENVKPYEYNPERAKQLLEEAGYAGEEIRIASRAVAYLGQQEVMEAIASYWAEIGVNANLQIMESGVHRDVRYCGIGNVDGDVSKEPPGCDHGDIYETSADLSSMDYSRLIYGWLSCTSPTSRVCEPRMEELGQRALVASGAERTQLLTQVADVVHEEVLLLGLFDGVIFIGQHADLDWEPRGFDRKIRVNTMQWKK